VAKSTPVEPGYSSQERSVRGIPPIAVVQNSDGTISFRL
ncbi:hypothetical protein AK812_SmicGene48215, partial [Symbiodinium microadriaticum]